MSKYFLKNCKKFVSTISSLVLSYLKYTLFGTLLSVLCNGFRERYKMNSKYKLCLDSVLFLLIQEVVLPHCIKVNYCSIIAVFCCYTVDLDEDICSICIVTILLKSQVLCTQLSNTFHVGKWWFAQGVEGSNLF